MQWTIYNAENKNQVDGACVMHGNTLHLFTRGGAVWNTTLGASICLVRCVRHQTEAFSPLYDRQSINTGIASVRSSREPWLHCKKLTYPLRS